MTTINASSGIRQAARAGAHAWKPPADGGLRRLGWSVLYAVLISLPFLGIGAWLLYSDYAETEARRVAAGARIASHDRLVTAPPAPVLAVASLVHGRDLFEGTCAACHKVDGTGIDGLGKNLTTSWFVASLDDPGLREFVKQGRPVNHPFNTTKVPMPPKGGHDELSDSDLGDIIVYVRGLQDPRRLPSLPPSALAVAAAAPPTEEEKAKALAAAGGDAELAGYIAHGGTLFVGTCSACHGRDARGLPKLGKDLVHSDFCRKLDDDALLAFVKRGRDPSDPLNTTQVAMPPKGGNPALSDDDLLDVISYVRSLQKQASVAP